MRKLSRVVCLVCSSWLVCNTNISVNVCMKISTPSIYIYKIVPKTCMRPKSCTKTPRKQIYTDDRNTELSPQQFDPSTGHDQPFVPTELIIMYPASGLLFECVVGV